ncbi:Uncharacterised protein [Porphyromonas macacae]|uniref:Uncharacterized protein n=2 Tax=Porphyromonas macacae TaxID=28115 RepID=A0A379E9D2_9PORP|nr:hypothetical protein [Porphyromonas macacae]SUB89288.1 Uncharacterised protein [Porphyromonas macacae]
MKKRKFDKLIDKHYANYKNFTPNEKMREIIINPSPAKWSSRLLDIYARDEFYWNCLNFWYNPGNEPLQRMIDALHILYISYSLDTKNENDGIVAGTVILPSYMLSMYIFSNETLKSHLVDIATKVLRVESRIKNQDTTWRVVEFLYDEILKRKGISWKEYLQEPTIELYQRAQNVILSPDKEVVDNLLSEMMDFHKKKAHIESFTKNPFYDPMWRVFPSEIFAMIRFRYLNGQSVDYISDEMLSHYTPYLQDARYKISPHIEQAIKELG